MTITLTSRHHSFKKGTTNSSIPTDNLPKKIIIRIETLTIIGEIRLNGSSNINMIKDLNGRMMKGKGRSKRLWVQKVLQY